MDSQKQPNKYTEPTQTEPSLFKFYLPIILPVIIYIYLAVDFAISYNTMTVEIPENNIEDSRGWFYIISICKMIFVGAVASFVAPLIYSRNKTEYQKLPDIHRKIYWVLVAALAVATIIVPIMIVNV